jgi:hypothetical protein
MGHARTTWEYHLESRHDAIRQDRLAELGAAGWELVAIADGYAVFKRTAATLGEIVTDEQRAHVFANLPGRAS